MSSTRHLPHVGASYYPYIDGLRAFAVLSVLIYHLHGPWLPGGFAGVDVFFVISGFIVSASLASYQGKSFVQFIGAFYARRIRRIFPALIVCLLITALVSSMFIPESWLSAVNKQTGLYAFFGLSNFILASSGRDYFAPTTEFNPYTHTWSLAVEEQFYLVFPLLFIAWLVGGRGRALSMGLFSVGAVASVIYADWQLGQNPTAAYFLTPGRFWELAVGVLIYQAVAGRAETDRPSMRGNFAGALFFLVMCSAFVYSDASDFPFPGALLAVVGTAGVLYVMHRRNGVHVMHAFLGHKLLTQIGRISYSLYLWHWPVYVLFRWTVGLDEAVTRIAAVAIAFIMAILSYRLVENPIRDAKSLRRMPQTVTIALGLVCIGISWHLGKTIYKNQSELSLSQVTANKPMWYPHGRSDNPAYPGCNADPEYHDVKGGLLLIYRAKGCADPRPENPRQLFVIGDSHALAYEGMFKQYAIREGMTVYAYNNGGCPFISLQPGRDDDDARCRGYAESALEDMKERMKAGDVLFLASLRMGRFSDQWMYFGEEGPENQMLSNDAVAGRERAARNATGVLTPIAEKGVHIVFEGPKPLFRSVPFRCADWFNHANPICAQGFDIPRALLERYRAPVLEAYQGIAAKVPDVHVWDPFPVLCPGEQCQAFDGDKPLFLDGDHLSGYGNETLLPSFTEYMSQWFGAGSAR
ncbi:acyltransferase family protein [Pseudomonas sp. Marseille-QA0892]